jgi:hypothetical protein
MLDGRHHDKVCSDGQRCLTAHLNTSGFALATDVPVVHSGLVETGMDLKDADVVDSKYMPFMCSYLQNALGCHKVLPINFVHRESGTAEALPDGRSQFIAARGDATGAIANVHSDFADEALLIQKMRQKMDEDDDTKGGRFVLINCWRPLATVHRWPLAVCDASSVRDEEDLYSRQTPENNNEVSNCFPERAMEGKHRWYYFPFMSPEEVILFKQWDEDTLIRSRSASDSQLRGVANQALHSAFDVAALPEAPARSSVEARFACIWKPPQKCSVNSRL